MYDKHIDGGGGGGVIRYPIAAISFLINIQEISDCSFLELDFKITRASQPLRSCAALCNNFIHH